MIAFGQLRRGVATLFVSLALASAACAAVPTLVYELPAASAEAGEAGAVTRTESGADDAPTDVSVAGSCPSQLPPGASVCCGAVPCNGNCAGQCSACQASCGPATLCCAHANSVVCRPVGSRCN